MGDDPFGPDAGRRVSLDEAQSKLPFQPLLPDTEKARVDDQSEVWLETGDLRVGLVFRSGIVMFAEAWQGVDGPKVWQEMIENGYPGEILQVGDRQVLGTKAGNNPDNSLYPSSAQFSEGGVTYEFFALPSSDASLDDLLDAVRSLNRGT